MNLGTIRNCFSFYIIPATEFPRPHCQAQTTNTIHLSIHVHSVRANTSSHLCSDLSLQPQLQIPEITSTVAYAISSPTKVSSVVWQQPSPSAEWNCYSKSSYALLGRMQPCPWSQHRSQCQLRCQLRRRSMSSCCFVATCPTIQYAGCMFDSFSCTGPRHIKSLMPVNAREMCSSAGAEP